MQNNGWSVQNSLSPFDITHAHIIELLDDFDLANDFNSIQMDKLAKYFKAYSTLTSMTILKEGQINDLLCFLSSGNVDIVKETAAGKNKILQTFGSGKIFGELSFFDRSPSSASVMAKNDAILLVLHREDWEKLSSEIPSIALAVTQNLIKSIASRLRETTGKLIDLL